ncbi:Na+/solute symporter [Actibacterium atlanticum]|uniref:histidine kinase n=1 Tax=Actibacterium atlanticum TaxID=1461693 RepID=A0A058ZKK2_9RHOB|nr:Na+/solute symporter [Actibacterium atlanticum]
MINFNILVTVCLVYVVALFAVAFWAERRARSGRAKWLRSPLIYTLSLSVYCTAWTFYGAVGYAARTGLEYLTIYLGPTLVLVGWWWLLRKLVRIGRTQHITSIADLISSRYGKSNVLGVIVTLMAVIGTTPYITLQLQSVTLSFSVFASTAEGGWRLPDMNSTALWVAAGLALFTILFGTRNLDANERHHGVVTAIAVEAVVKLVALIAVGVFVVWGVSGGIGAMAQDIAESPIADAQFRPGRWVGLTALSAAAILTLPRMFQVLVVENADERHVETASWAFPLYLCLISLFVVPIAVTGLATQPATANPDLFVLTVPLSMDQQGLATLAFLGGFSSATSMVIVASIALATMVSNHIVMPLWLHWQNQEGAMVSGDVRKLLLRSRRLSIGGVLVLGYLYFRLTGGSEALASIGLISFTGVAQVLPAMIGGIFWRGATKRGALVGLLVGSLVWAYTLFLPSFGPGGILSESIMVNGPWGLEWLRPQSMFGVGGLDPLVHAMFWSLTLNTFGFLFVSLLGFPSPMERLQGAQFVNVFEHSTSAQGWAQSRAEAEDLLMMTQRILGAEDAQALFLQAANEQGKKGYLPDITPGFLERLERQISGSVGAATAHAMIGQIVGRTAVSVGDLMAVADETAQMMETSNQLKAKSDELTRTARQLREANEKLTELSIQKDAFLSQISHELRTPMTSIRAFSEILMEDEMLNAEDAQKYSSIINEEAIRLTRLLDDLLDLSVLENAQISLTEQDGNLGDLIDQAVATTSTLPSGDRLGIRRDKLSEDIDLHTDTDRLTQVFINLIANAQKYCDAEEPVLSIRLRKTGGRVAVDFTDNGSGIPTKSQSIIFEKFARLSDGNAAGGAGLGLAICREIMTKLGGDITYLPGQGGASFRVTLPPIPMRQRR